MDLLIHRIGQPPYQWEDLVAICEEQMTLTEELLAGKRKVLRSSGESIRLLEALASVCFGGFEAMVLDFNVMGPSVLDDIPRTISELKDILLTHNDEDIRSAEGTELSSLCSGCAWINERIGDGLVAVVSASAWSFTKLWRFIPESLYRDVAQELEVFSPPKDEPLCDMNIQFIRQQLSMSEHEPKNDTGFTPTRLIDLGPSQASNIKIINPKSMRSHSRQKKPPLHYAALSYCWGPPADAVKQPRLLANNISRLGQSFDAGDMSPVMEDAALVCKKFDIRYLWIDALCIIQDSKTDWEEQSQQMAQVYENSYLTICAAASSSCLEGFLTSRPRLPEFQYISPIYSGATGSFCLRPLSGYDSKSQSPLSIVTKSPFRQDLEASSWNTRGWVFQEKAMSATKLFFGRTMIHLQLMDWILSENGYTEATRSIGESDQPWSGDLASVLAPEIGLRIYELWQIVVSHFRRLQWTDPRDLFPGLSGIAFKFYQLTHDDYLAGHWINDLGCSLIWTPGTQDHTLGFESLEQLVEYLAVPNIQNTPSWSWASRPVFGRFTISMSTNTRCRIRTHLRPEFRILRASASIEGVNDFGRINGATLSVSGRMVQLPRKLLSEWEPESSVNKWYSTLNEGYRIFVSQDWQPEWDVPFTGDTPIGRASWNEPLTTKDVPPSGTTEDQDLQLMLLLISSCCSEWPDEPAETFESMELPPDFNGSLNRVAYRPSYRHTFLRDWNLEEGTAEQCEYCSNLCRRRDVWGLLVYPAKEPGRFYRVGVFLSRAEHGGSDIFLKAEVHDLELA
ncbi:putative protein of unknown function with het domain [Paramyrothecium foliicola]|nr:putative protein of unknown function with het domain [Paramyrothecium foliicola]